MSLSFRRRLHLAQGFLRVGYRPRGFDPRNSDNAGRSDSLCCRKNDLLAHDQQVFFIGNQRAAVLNTTD